MKNLDLDVGVEINLEYLAQIEEEMNEPRETDE